MEPKPEFKTEGQTLDFANAESEFTPTPESLIPVSEVHDLLKRVAYKLHDMVIKIQAEDGVFSHKADEPMARLSAVQNLHLLLEIWGKKDRNETENGLLQFYAPELGSLKSKKPSDA